MIEIKTVTEKIETVIFVFFLNIMCMSLTAFVYLQIFVKNAYTLGNDILFICGALAIFIFDLFMSGMIIVTYLGD